MKQGDYRWLSLRSWLTYRSLPPTPGEIEHQMSFSFQRMSAIFRNTK
jgi:hypothetical protein